MRRARIEAEERPAAVGELAALAHDAGLRLGWETRRGNGTTAKPRGGRHNRLSPEEKAERRVMREAKRRERQQEAETLRDTARGRAARRRRDQEDERAGRRRRPIRAIIEEKDRPRVTAAGGRKLERKAGGDGGGRSRSSIESEAKLRSLVLKLKARCLGGKGQGAWRAGELANFLRYLTRVEGLAGSPSAAIVTNIVAPEIEPGTDAFVQRLYGCGLAIEQVEQEVDPSGQVYRHLTIPLPHGLGAAGRRAIADGYARALAKRGLLYLTAIHAPSPDGDQRNDHLHIAVISRPGERSGDYAWSFSASKDRLLFSPAMVKVWRRFSVALFNDQLQQAGLATRYTLEPALDPEIARGRVATAQLRERANAAENRLERAHRDRNAAVRIEDMAARLVDVGNSLKIAAIRSATLVQRATGDLLGPMRERAIVMRAASAAAIGHGAALLTQAQSVPRLRAIRRKIASRMLARPDPEMSASSCAWQTLVAKRDSISLRRYTKPTRTAAIAGLRMVRRRAAMKSLNSLNRHDAPYIALSVVRAFGTDRGVD